MSNKDQIEKLSKLNTRLRRWILQMSTAAGSGHPTSSLSAVESMSALLFGCGRDRQSFFRFDLDNPDRPDNDRLIFSKGHASPLYYALWAAAGVIDEEELMTFRRFDSVLEGHPTRRFKLTEVPTGSLGQGLSAGVGMALYARDIAHTTARTFVLVGDSETAEGQIWEAMQLAAYYGLNNLFAIVDVNRLGQRGQTMLGWDTEKYRARSEAFGWRAIVVDGHDVGELLEAYEKAVFSADERPTMIVARTVKGKGVSFLEDANDWHGKPLNEEQLAKALAELGEVDIETPFELAKPENSLSSTKNRKSQKEIKQPTYETGDKIAPRDAYGDTLAQLVRSDETIAVLDAETSNSTRADRAKAIVPERFFEMFIAEQNMVSSAVGLSRRGIKPFVSTFAAFLTRAADQIRMAQYTEADIVFVGSHCGVSIGADGESQMGLEDLSLFGSLRESVILYPADAVSMTAAVLLARDCRGITYLRSTRDALPVVYDQNEKFVIGGAKEHFVAADNVATICAAGVTFHEALAAVEKLRAEGISVRVIDCYSVRPLAEEIIFRAARETGRIVVVEDHYAGGGLGSTIAMSLARENIDCAFEHLCVRKTPRSGAMKELLAYEEIDTDAIIKTVKRII